MRITYTTIKSYIALFALVLFSPLAAQQLRGFLTQEDIELFYKQGYVVKRACIDSEAVASMQEHVTAAIDRSLQYVQESLDQTLTDSDQLMYINGSRIVFKRRPDHSISIARINGVGGMQPEILATVRSEKMVHTFFELLGTTDLEHIISQVHPKLPGDGIAYPKHRDVQFRKSFDPEWQDILGNGSYAICIIPIDPMNQENGGLWVDKNNYPEDHGLPMAQLWVDAQPGDLLFMHPHLFHGSGPNTSSMSRKTLLTGFCAYGANHKQYPGAYVNTHLSFMSDGTITTEPAPWSTVFNERDANH